MNFSIAKIIRRLFAPSHELSCAAAVWRRLTRDLRARGGGKRESGAFLLGYIENDGRRRIIDYVLYDDLDPHSLDTGIVRLDGRHFGRLWDLCRERGVTVIADVHTHPYGAGQSDSDRAHPIIARAGHIALIVPDFAAPPIPRQKLGIYRYGGARKWETISPAMRRRFFHVGL